MEKCDLSKAEICRYSRQLIMPEFGPQGQCKLRSSRVLIVGAGGLGCPAAVYLTASGVGTLGVVDYDDVEISNLHRQVMHNEESLGSPKAVSLTQRCSQLNSSLMFHSYIVQLNSLNALGIIKKYDVVLDCTDNVATRYLLNDACILAGKPLVSGSALRQEGQLTVYGWKGGPCYRCLFPRPPPAETVTNCSDGGVLGVVPGIIGTMQAAEVIKIITGSGNVCAQRMLLYDNEWGTMRNIKLRPRQTDCAVCGESPTVKELTDMSEFCGASPDDKDAGLSLLDSKDRITVDELNSAMNSNAPPVIIDVRPTIETEICKLKSTTINIPIDKILSDKSSEDIRLILDLHKNKIGENQTNTVIFICRRGNDSQRAVAKLKNMFSDTDVVVKDVIGGLTSWANQIDREFPIY